MSDFTPAGVVMSFWRWFWVGIGALALIGVFTLGMWQAGWWFSNANINRQTQQIQNSDSNQRALVSDLTTKVGDVGSITVQMDAASGQQLADLHAQRIGEANIACQDAEQVNVPLRQGLGAWVKSNCLAGTVSPGSSLRK
jgi:hypothetical protein